MYLCFLLGSICSFLNQRLARSCVYLWIWFDIFCLHIIFVQKKMDCRIEWYIFTWSDLKSVVLAVSEECLKLLSCVADVTLFSFLWPCGVAAWVPFWTIANCLNSKMNITGFIFPCHRSLGRKKRSLCCGLNYFEFLVASFLGVKVLEEVKKRQEKNHHNDLDLSLLILFLLKALVHLYPLCCCLITFKSHSLTVTLHFPVCPLTDT